jgi:hypothetical protein
MRCYEVQGITVPAIDHPVVGIADLYGMREDRCKYWLQIPS